MSVVSPRGILPAAIPLGQMPEFHAQDTCLDGIEPAVVAFDFMVVLPGLPMIA